MTLDDLLTYARTRDQEWVENTDGYSGVRCQAYLDNGGFLPCLRLMDGRLHITDLVERLDGTVPGAPSPGRAAFESMLSNEIWSSNAIGYWMIERVEPSPNALPVALREAIGPPINRDLWAWVFEMRDGARFNYGSCGAFDFLRLPDGYGFQDVAKVLPRKVVDQRGKLRTFNSQDKSLHGLPFYSEMKSIRCWLPLSATS